MMTRPFLLATVYWTTTLRPTLGFLVVTTARTTSSRSSKQQLLRHFASPSETSLSLVENCVSRLGLLQTLLSKHGAPGSRGCHQPNNDLVPVTTAAQDTPELLASMMSTSDEKDWSDLHPYLFPIAQSQTTGNVICAYRSPATEESDKNHPWPIVESRVGAPGMELLSLNSEHLMRRIVCEFDFAKTDADLVQLYNEGLGKGLMKEAALDTPYETGSVEKLGYGVDKYVLLRVGPFPDLYRSMAELHLQKNDEQSALIAAEAANSKLSGFGSTFRFYASLLKRFPNRQEETRDAARMCLRLPLPTIGIDVSDLEEVAHLGQMADASASSQECLGKIKDMYTLMKQVEDEQDNPQSGKTQEQIKMEQADELINDAVLTGKSWSSIRPELSEIFRSVGRDDMASFVDC